MLKMWYTQQSEPQRAGLNEHVNLSAVGYAQCSFTAWARGASLTDNQPL